MWQFWWKTKWPELLFQIQYNQYLLREIPQVLSLFSVLNSIEHLPYINASLWIPNPVLRQDVELVIQCTKKFIFSLSVGKKIKTFKWFTRIPPNQDLPMNSCILLEFCSNILSLSMAPWTTNFRSLFDIFGYFIISSALANFNSINFFFLAIHNFIHF